jgi:hypothetical protein
MPVVSVAVYVVTPSSWTVGFRLAVLVASL